MLKQIISILFIFTIAGCSNLDKLNKTRIEGNDFNALLAKDYLNFSNQEATLCDWKDSAYFAKKGLMAAHGKKTLPEYQAKRVRIPGPIREELNYAREQLLSRLTEHNKAKFPKETSSAQFFYDCWVEQEEEGWQINDISLCKNNFLSALHNIDVMTSSHKDHTHHHLKSEHTHTLHFGLDKYDIKGKNYRVLKELANEIKAKGNVKIISEGYADKTGTEKHNKWLSKRRAEAAKEALVNFGVDKDSIEIGYYGDDRPAVETPKGVPERLNRRVVIEQIK